MEWDQTGAAFELTSWTLLDGLTRPEERQRALNALAERYWPPVYAFLRRRGLGRDRAAELTQGFFADVVLERKLFDAAERDRGRLRSLLLAALNNYVVDQNRRRRVHRDERALSLQSLRREEAYLADSPADDVEAAFERRWALVLLHEALREAEAHFTAMDRGRYWRAFSARVLGPTTAMLNPPNNGRLAEELGFRGPADVSNAVYAVKKRVVTTLKRLVAETTARQDADTELSYVLGALGAPPVPSA